MDASVQLLIDSLNEVLTETRAALEQSQSMLAEVTARAEADRAGRLAAEALTAQIKDIAAGNKAIAAAIAGIVIPVPADHGAAIQRIETAIQALADRPKPGPITFIPQRDAAGTLLRVVAEQ